MSTIRPPARLITFDPTDWPVPASMFGDATAMRRAMWTQARAQWATEHNVIWDEHSDLPRELTICSACGNASAQVNRYGEPAGWYAIRQCTDERSAPQFICTMECLNRWSLLDLVASA